MSSLNQSLFQHFCLKYLVKTINLLSKQQQNRFMLYLFIALVVLSFQCCNRNTHLLNARSSDSVQVALNSLEIFRVFRTQQLKSCLEEISFVNIMFS